MKKEIKNWLIIFAIVLTVFSLYVLIERYFERCPETRIIYITPPKHEVKERASSTYDFRKYRVTEILVNATWQKEVMENFSYTLKDENFNTLMIKIGFDNIFNMTTDNIEEGDYYIRIRYPAEFVNGGVENFFGWFLVSFEDNNDTLVLNFFLSPAEYYDYPSILID